jgi:hypothetical protein
MHRRTREQCSWRGAGTDTKLTPDNNPSGLGGPGGGPDGFSGPEGVQSATAQADNCEADPRTKQMGVVLILKLGEN